MKKIYLLPLIIIFTLSHAAQEFRQRIETALENRDYPTALDELKALEKSDPKLFINNNYDYLLARLAEKRGDLALAMIKYQAVEKRNLVLSEYAKWHLAQIARSSGNLMLERVYLQRLLAENPDSLLIPTASNRLARSFFESGGFETAIDLLRRTPNLLPGSQTAAPSAARGNEPVLGNLTQKDPRTRENLVLLGNAYLQLKKFGEAREVFNHLVTNLPNVAQPDDFALEGAKGLDLLDSEAGAFGKTAPSLTDGDHLKRAAIYQFNRSFSFARLHYRALVERFPTSPFTPEALYQIGRSYALELTFDEAVKWFERVHSEFPDHPTAETALSQAASAYSRLNKPKEAVARYQKFIDKYPESGTLERAFLNIVDIERDLGASTEALKWTQKTREKFKGKLPEAVALFAQARIRIAENNWTDALNDLTELERMTDLGGTRVPGGTNKNEIAFLRALALEQLGRIPEAVDAYLMVPDGRAEYYGWRSNERLRELLLNPGTSEPVNAKLNTFVNLAAQNVIPETAHTIRQAAQTALRLTTDPGNRANLLEVVKKTYSLLPAYQKIPVGKLQEFGRREVLRESAMTGSSHQSLADELLFLKLYDEAAPELETALREKLTTDTNSLNDFAPDTAYTLAVFYNRGEMSHRSIAYIEPQWRSVPADYQIEAIPREQIELLYPVPFVDSLLRFGPERNVDPRFALSIMRQESRYRADVKSNAAARGLMQFISDTSNKIAEELGKRNFNQDELYHPPTAILFGSQYLGKLFKLFPNQPPAVAASYNGGEHNMSRWLARAKSELPDRYIPEIMFSQSKDYVYKVMANYRVYQILYDENLKAR
jgi:soluble lytic murein transglycosylase